MNEFKDKMISGNNNGLKMPKHKITSILLVIIEYVESISITICFFDESFF